MGSFQAEKAWADGHLNEINRVVRKLIGKIIDIVPTDLERDRIEAIDYEIKVPSGDIACRIRRAERCRYRDLTLTALRHSGAISEVQKILQGHAGWYLYAWARDSVFVDWMFVDLDVVRDREVIQNALKRKQYRDLPDGNRFLCIPFGVLHECGAVVDSTLEAGRSSRQVS